MLSVTLEPWGLGYARGVVVFAEVREDGVVVDAREFAWCQRHVKECGGHLREDAEVVLERLVNNEAYVRLPAMAPLYEAPTMVCCQTAGAVSGA